MNIYINNIQQTFNEKITINSLLDKINLRFSQGVAIAINDAVIPKSEWENIDFREDDKITIIKAAAGG